jgi:hypothetical protein
MGASFTNQTQHIVAGNDPVKIHHPFADQNKSLKRMQIRQA